VKATLNTTKAVIGTELNFFSTSANALEFSSATKSPTHVHRHQPPAAAGEAVCWTSVGQHPLRISGGVMRAIFILQF
jgi:hypothetical protein